MTRPEICKPESIRATANLVDYARTCENFSWDAERLELSGLPEGRGLNIAHEAVDRYARGPRRNHVALRWVDRYNRAHDFTYAELSQRSNRFADLLQRLGVPRGERVFTLLGRVPDLYVAVLGTLKTGCVLSPLFPAYDAEPIRQRLQIGEAGVLVTTPELYRRTVAAIRDSIPSLREVLVTGDESEPGTLGLTRALAASSPFFEIEPTAPDDPAFLYFTSGTTGAPKGALHVHEAVLAQHATAKYALDLHPDDIFWCSADPDCVTGMSYGVIAPLTHGVTLLSDEGEFDARRRYSVLADQRVTVWYATPAALRTLTRHGSEPPAGFDLSALRFVASGGEPLAPEAVVWGQDVLGLPVHDNWSQTETGAIMIGNFAAEPIRPGAMGRPLPGVEARLLTRDEDGEWHEPAGADQAGELALRRGWPSMFRGYWRAPARYDESFSDGWYLSGDIARRDEDGYYWFIGRTDDVIVSAGILIGPFEVENALMGHPAVAEAGVIGKPDAAAGELVKAFVTLDDGYRPTDALRRVLLDFGRRVLGAAAPREIEFDRQLPHTRSGKVLRRLLKARELGLPEGDLSTVECAS